MLIKYQDLGTKYKKKQMQNYINQGTVFIWAMSMCLFPPLTWVRKKSKAR